MSESISPFLKMSFETCTQFLTDACAHSKVDELKTPSAAIITGKINNGGTGVFDILHKF